ncbi:MAG: IPT/TIG domain-containing protein [Polyangiaceae bacterium]|nr:IPT/TIG domain-containing protein [Polyangiaceae bacterium]
MTSDASEPGEERAPESEPKPDASRGEPARVVPPGEPVVGILAEPDLPPPASVPRPMPAPAVRVLPKPAVDELAPTEGLTVVETRVVLRGKHLYRESIVRFGGVIAMPIGAVEPWELTVLAPSRDKAGPVEVTVQNPGAHVLSLPSAYRYVALPQPQILVVAPHRGAVRGGTEISVSGKHFVAGSVVLVDGVRAKTRFVDAETLEARTPPGKAGAMVAVAVENPDGKRAVTPRAYLYDDRY